MSLIYFCRQYVVWDMLDGCKTPCGSIGTCFETIWLYQTSETHFFTPKFQLWVRQLVLKTSLCVQESLRSPLDLGFLLPDLGFLLPDLGSWILDYELWIMNYELWILNYEVWIVNYELRIVNSQLWIIKSHLWIPIPIPTPASAWRLPSHHIPNTTAVCFNPSHLPH